MKACTLWEKDTPAYMDDVELADARFTPENFDVIDKPGSSSGAKVAKITKPLDDPEVPDGSWCEGLK